MGLPTQLGMGGALGGITDRAVDIGRGGAAQVHLKCAAHRHLYFNIGQLPFLLYQRPDPKAFQKE